MSQPAPCVHIPYVQNTIYEYKISVSHSFAQARGQEQGREHDSLFDSACAWNLRCRDTLVLVSMIHVTPLPIYRRWPHYKT